MGILAWFRDSKVIVLERGQVNLEDRVKILEDAATGCINPPAYSAKASESEHSEQKSHEKAELTEDEKTEAKKLAKKAAAYFKKPGRYISTPYGTPLNPHYAYNLPVKFVRRFPHVGTTTLYVPFQTDFTIADVEDSVWEIYHRHSLHRKAEKYKGKEKLCLTVQKWHDYDRKWCAKSTFTDWTTESLLRSIWWHDVRTRLIARYDVVDRKEVDVAVPISEVDEKGSQQQMDASNSSFLL
ncbi:MAG: hypothetical protein M1820_003557 [Bogoriella megaspora]|nr:MAG: hypothetical protein M1820_003557 [Bogoriella megaspora]